MSSRILIAACLLASSAFANAQQNTDVQAQGQGSVQGQTSIDRNNSAVQSQATGQGAASGSVTRGEKSVSADSGAATNAVLSGSLDAKKSKPGDPVTAKTTEPSSTPDHTSLPKGTKLLGHVTQAKAAGKGEGQSTLGFVFDRAVLKDGREVPINTTVRALAAGEGAGDVAGSSGDTMGGSLGGGAMSSASSSASALGGVGGQAGGVLGSAGQVTGRATGTVSGVASHSARTLSGSAGAIGGLTAHGLLSPDSRGVFGMQNLNLAQSSSGSGSIVSSSGRSLRLESGTRMLLDVQSAASRSTDAGSTEAAPAAKDPAGADKQNSGRPRP